MSNGKLARILIFNVLLWTTGIALAGEPVIPRVAPRPANTLIMLPDGSTVHAELAQTESEQAYGLMDRTNLPDGRGMLFAHDRSGRYPYWMYHCQISLDIVWMDEQHRIMEIAAETPPCRGAANSCPSYGGHADARYVLELPSGYARKHRVVTGEVVRFAL